MAAAFAAAMFTVGGDGVPVFGQQNLVYSGGCSTCSNCYSQVEFPSTVAQTFPVSQPLPVQTFSESQPYPVAQSLPLPTTSSFVASTPNDAIIPGQIVNETYATWPASNIVSQPVASGPIYSGATTIGQTISSPPIGTFTSMPAPVMSSTIPIESSPVFSQPVTYATSYPTPVSSTAPLFSTTPVRSTMAAGYRAVGNSVGTLTSGLAQAKADQAAFGRIRGHVGGGLGGANYEGVGWSNQSPQAAVQQCCYWGTRPVSQIGVRRGNDGCWYACVLYR